MASDIIISAHGGRYQNQQKNLILPTGSQIAFYVDDKGILSNTAGYRILADLQNNIVDRTEFTQITSQSGTTYNYSCWFAPQFKNYCGIFQVGTNQLVKSLSEYTKAYPLYLGEILRDYPNCAIYWLCCREILTGGSPGIPAGSHFMRPRLKLGIKNLSAPIGEVPGASVLGYGFNSLGTFDMTSITQQIFIHNTMQASQFTYNPTQMTYWVPDNTSVIPSTTTTGSAQVFMTQQQFQSYFAAKAGISGSYGAFSAQFNAAYSQTSSTDMSFYYGLYESDYTGWTLALADESASWLNPGFISDPDVMALPTSFSKSNQGLFFNVFRKFGTHFISQLTVGGSFDYYVAAETTFTSNAAQIQANIALEYNALFEAAAGEASADWDQLGETWTQSRLVTMNAVGGDTTILAGLQASYGESYSDVFAMWSSAVMSNPAVISFQLSPLSRVFSGDQAQAVGQAIQAYLNGAILATANADYTPGTGPGGGNFTTSSTIIANGQLCQPIPPVAPPAPLVQNQIVYPIGGYQIAVLESGTLIPILSYTYYQDPSSLANEQAIYAEIMEDVSQITETGYYVVVAGFAIDLMNYPSVDFAEWLASCGAQMSGWQQYIGFTGNPVLASYVMIGRQGLLPGNAIESFAATGNWVDDPSSSTTDVSGLALLYAESALGFSSNRGATVLKSLAGLTSK